MTLTQYLLPRLDYERTPASNGRDFRGQVTCPSAASPVSAVLFCRGEARGCASKRISAQSTRILDTAEAIRKFKSVLEGIELALRVRVVVRYIWVAMGSGSTQSGHLQRHRLGGHRGLAISVDGQIASHAALFDAWVSYQQHGQFGGFAGNHHPTHHVTAEDFQDEIEVKVGSLGRPQKLRYVQAPNLIGLRGQQFRLLVLRVPKLVAALLQLPVFS